MTKRCPCGAGLAYDPKGPSGVIHGGWWDCSDILLGRAIPRGEPGWRMHEDRLPFVFYEIKSEQCVQARNLDLSTRPRPTLDAA